MSDMKKFFFLQLLVMLTILLFVILNIINLKDSIIALSIVLSSLGVTYVANESLNKNTKISILNTTINKLDKDYPVRNDHYASGVEKIASILSPLGKTGEEITFQELDDAIMQLTKEEHSKIKELVNYYSDIARGVINGLYDENWVLVSLSGAHILVWIECWPFIKRHQLLDQRSRHSYNIETTSGITPMYYYYEEWIKMLLNNNNICPIPDPTQVAHTVALIKNT